MSTWAEQIEAFCLLAGPSVLLIIPFLIVFLVLRIRSAVLNSIILFSICVLLEFIWWVAGIAAIVEYGPKSAIGDLLLVPNIFVILTIILYVEIIKVTAPIKTALILTSLCGFFHAFGMWLKFCASVGPGISADNVHLVIIFSSMVGIVGAVAYPIVSGIFHCAFNLIKQIYTEVNQG